MKINNSIVAFDLDGTITKRDTYLPFLFGYMIRHPYRLVRTLHLPFAVLMYFLQLRNNSWLKQVFLKACLGNLSRISLNSWANQFTQCLLESGLRAGAIDKLNKYKGEGVKLVLVSASFDIYVEKIGIALGFNHVISTNVEWDDKDRLTGGLIGKNCYGQEKVHRISKWLRDTNQTQVDIVYTDHHSDLPLLQWANVGVAVNPTEKLRLLSLGKNIKVEIW